MRVPLWDLPVRAFHWLVAALVVFSFVTGKAAGDWLPWHFRSGYAILTLVIFRVAWGLVGSETARFSSFVRGPGAAMAYLRETAAGRHRTMLGHNPLGAWMVLLLLLVLAAQAASGLFVDDEVASQGPLASTVSNAVVARMGAVHHYNQWLVVAAVALHVVAIVVYHRVFKANLVGPMVHGSVEWPADTPPPRQASMARALVLLTFAASAVYWLVVLYPRAD